MSEGKGSDLPIRRLEDAVRRLREATAGRERRGRSHDDADDTVGTAETDDAIGFDPFPLLRALHEHGVVAAVIGQVAGIMHGSTELTGDLDLLWDGDPGQAPAFAAAFAAAGATLTDDDGTRCQATVAPDGLVIHYLDRADLIRMRRAIGRPKDLRRAAELEALASD